MIVLLLFFYINLAFVVLLALYPLISWLRALLFPKPHLKSFDAIPPVSIIIACSNEERFIQRKIESFLHEDEWIEGSEIIVISNGSTDRTNAILDTYATHPQVKVFFEPHQHSKIKSVNRGVKEAQHELLVFSDCRQVMKTGSVKQLLSNFADPAVGTVNATLTDADGKSNYSFRALLNFIARCDSRSGSSLNVFGALYAQRKSVFREFPTDLLFDDLFVIVSTLIQKKRLINEANAVIYDLPFEAYYMQNRIQRLARGLLIFLFNHFSMIRLLPFTTFMRFMVFKYVKLILPFVILFLCVDGFLLLYHHHLQAYVLNGFLSVALLCIIAPVRRALLHFLKINYNFMIATIRFLFFNKRSNTWDKLNVSNLAKR